MKATDFTKLKGDTDIDKCKYMLSLSPTPVPLVYVQQKINGVQLRITRDTISTNNNKLYAKNFFGSLLSDLQAKLRGGLVVYAEAFVPGVPLATISGAVSVSRAKMDDTYKDAIEFHLWDSHDYYDAPCNRPFPARADFLLDLAYNKIHVVKSEPYDDALMLDSYYHSTIVSAEAEGVIYRIPPCLHFADDSTSVELIKRKRRTEVEYPCIGVTEGKGKRTGMLGAFIVQTPKGVVKVGGGKGLSDDQLKYYYAHPPIGKPITVSYEELSINGLPLRVQFVAVRDYE